MHVAFANVDSCSHRWNHDTKVWVQETDEEAEQRKLEALERHNAELAAETAESQAAT